MPQAAVELLGFDARYVECVDQIFPFESARGSAFLGKPVHDVEDFESSCVNSKGLAEMGVDWWWPLFGC